MVITEQEVVELIIAQLEANITDPLSGRLAKGKKWIYDDPPRMDLSSYPRISVTPVQSSYAEFALGDQEQQLEDMTILLEIVTRKSDKINVKGDSTPERAEQIVDFLAKEVRQFMKSNYATWNTNNILSLRPETNNRSVVPGDKGELVVQRMTYLARVVN